MGSYIFINVQKNKEILGRFSYRIDYTSQEKIIDLIKKFVSFYNDTELQSILADHLTPYEQVAYVLEDIDEIIENHIGAFVEERKAYETIKNMNLGLNKNTKGETNYDLYDFMANVECYNSEAIHSLWRRKIFKPSLDDDWNNYVYINLDENTFSFCCLRNVVEQEIEPTQEILNLESITVPLGNAEEFLNLFSKENSLFRFNGKIYKTYF